MEQSRCTHGLGLRPTALALPQLAQRVVTGEPNAMAGDKFESGQPLTRRWPKKPGCSTRAGCCTTYGTCGAQRRKAKPLSLESVPLHRWLPIDTTGLPRPHRRGSRRPACTVTGSSRRRARARASSAGVPRCGGASRARVKAGCEQWVANFCTWRPPSRTAGGLRALACRGSACARAHSESSPGEHGSIGHFHFSPRARPHMPHENKPPVHFSESDPWRVYRLALRRAELARLPPPRHYSKQGSSLRRVPALTQGAPPDPWREYRFALRRVSERLRSGHDLVLHSHHGPTARNSLGGSSNYRGRALRRVTCSARALRGVINALLPGRRRVGLCLASMARQN